MTSPSPAPSPSHAPSPGSTAPAAHTAADVAWLRRAVELAHDCPPSTTAFSVGAVIVDAEGRELASGHSRELAPDFHAEESALAKLAGTPVPAGATLYSSLEPCSRRASRPTPCSELVIASGIRRVVIAWREPDVFVTDCQGVRLMAESGVDVIEIPELAESARAANAHLRF
ncbi:dCMP deaminase [Streptomyces zaomyceticus]|uniref:dCMP deaminase n=1 Tax=Streptomyces zaomyceticus TaxID=68286 RepID=UPI003863CB6E